MYKLDVPIRKPMTKKRTDEEQRHKNNMARMKRRKKQKAREHEERAKVESERLEEAEVRGFKHGVAAVCKKFGEYC